MGAELLLVAVPQGPLRLPIARWCRARGILLREVDRHAPDLIALRFALAAVDRSYLGWEAWQDFCAYRLATGDQEGCVILVDGHGWPVFEGSVLLAGCSTAALVAALEYGWKEASC